MLVSILSVFIFMRSQQQNAFQLWLGIYLHAAGTKRRVIGTLNRAGVSMEGAQDGINFLSGSSPVIDLSKAGDLGGGDLVETDEALIAWEEKSKFKFFASLKSVLEDYFPEGFQFPETKVIDPLPLKSEDIFPVSAKKYNDATPRGNMDWYETLFLEQLGLDRSEFVNKKKVILTAGDLGTVIMVNSAKSRRTHELNPFDTLSWAIPIPQLLHTRMKIIELIFKSCFGVHHGSMPERRGVVDISSLEFAATFLDRKRVLKKQPSFRDSEELVLHVWPAHILTLFLKELDLNNSFASGSGFFDKEAIVLAIRAKGETKIRAAVSSIITKYFSHFYVDDERKKKPLERDACLENFVIFLQLTFYYCCSKRSIKSGDLGWLEWCIDRNAYGGATGPEMGYRPVNSPEDVGRTFLHTAADYTLPEIVSEIPDKSMRFLFVGGAWKITLGREGMRERKFLHPHQNASKEDTTGPEDNKNTSKLNSKLKLSDKTPTGTAPPTVPLAAAHQSPKNAKSIVEFSTLEPARKKLRTPEPTSDSVSTNPKSSCTYNLLLPPSSVDLTFSLSMTPDFRSHSVIVPPASGQPSPNTPFSSNRNYARISPRQRTLS
ncbi:hypothetical protein RUND412_006714 [Rhizina undulata]